MNDTNQRARQYKIRGLLVGLLLASLLTACREAHNATPSATPAPAQSSVSTATPTGQQNAAPVANSTPNNSVKLYYSKGTVQGTNPANPSVDLDHEDIKGMMPAMRMEFYVKDKAMLNGLKAGDKVQFTLEDNKGALMITELKK